MHPPITTRPIPLAIVTGFLGSGKTTLIKHLLTQPGLGGTLVIVNEFGEVGIDHVLLEASSDDTILLANGCLCCTIRGNLVDTLIDVLKQREEGRIGAFDRVVVETSGVADPAPLLAFLLSEEKVTARYRLDTLVTTCDLVNGEATLERQAEARSQLRLADRILFTKRDLVDADRLAQMTALVRGLNPTAEMIALAHGEADPALILEPLTRDRPVMASADSACGSHHGHEHPHDHHPYADSDHTRRFMHSTFSPNAPLTSAQIAKLIAALREHASPVLLRIKGVLPVEYDPRPLIVQGALMVVHDPYFLAREGAVGRLVVISEGPLPEDLATDLMGLGLAPGA